MEERTVAVTAICHIELSLEPLRDLVMNVFIVRLIHTWVFTEET